MENKITADNSYELFRMGKIDCDGKTFEETKRELNNAYIDMFVVGHTGELGIYLGKDGQIHSYIFGSGTHLNPNVVEEVLFQESRESSVDDWKKIEDEKVFDVDDWKEIEDEKEIEKILTEKAFDVEEVERLYCISTTHIYQNGDEYIIKDEQDDDWFENDFNFCW